MKNRAFQNLIFLSTLLFLAAPGLCQTQYSLTDLVTKADALSETIKIAKEDIYIAQQDKQRALSVLIPRLTAFGSASEHRNEDVGNPDTLTAGVKFTQSFTLNGKEIIAFEVTKKTIESREFSLETVRAEYLLQVSQAYYNILSAQRAVEIAQSDVKRLSAHLNAVKEKLNVGNVTKTDLYRAQAELSRSQTEQVKAENGLLQRKAALLNLVDIDADFTLAKGNSAGMDDFITTQEEIRTAALANRSEIKTARKNLEIAKKNVTFKKSDYWPEISLEAGYKETDISYDYTGPEIQYDTEDLYITGQLTFTLFDGGLRRAQIRQALSEQKKAALALDLEEKKVILDSKVSYLDYATAKQSLISLADELTSAQENFNAVKMQFKYGLADSIDMMDANTLLVTAQRRISDARYTFYLAVLKILHTRGDLTRFLLAAAD